MDLSRKSHKICSPSLFKCKPSWKNFQTMPSLLRNSEGGSMYLMNSLLHNSWICLFVKSMQSWRSVTVRNLPVIFPLWLRCKVSPLGRIPITMGTLCAFIIISKIFWKERMITLVESFSMLFVPIKTKMYFDWKPNSPFNSLWWTCCNLLPEIARLSTLPVLYFIWPNYVYCSSFALLNFKKVWKYYCAIYKIYDYIQGFKVRNPF